MIEFANTSLAKDTNEKRLAYASANIQDYWVANLHNRLLIVYRYPEEGDYKLQQRLISGSISPIAFPDIALEICQLLA